MFLGALGVIGARMRDGLRRGASSAHTAPSAAAAACKASIAIEAPFATGPVAQLGLEQLHFAELAVADGQQGATASRSRWARTTRG